MESRHYLVCKINAPISLYYVLFFFFRHGLSYLVMRSLKMICALSVWLSGHLILLYAHYIWLCAPLIWL